MLCGPSMGTGCGWCGATWTPPCGHLAAGAENITDRSSVIRPQEVTSSGNRGKEDTTIMIILVIRAQLWITIIMLSSSPHREDTITITIVLSNHEEDPVILSGRWRRTSRPGSWWRTVRARPSGWCRAWDWWSPAGISIILDIIIIIIIILTINIMNVRKLPITRTRELEGATLLYPQIW